MPDRRDFLVFTSLAGAMAALFPDSFATAQASTITVPKVVDFTKEMRKILDTIYDTEPGTIQAFNFVYQRIAKEGCSDNCGCNSVCGCNENVDCCENKCGCEKKGSSKLNLDVIRRQDPYIKIISKFNPEQIETFNQLLDILPQFGGVFAGAALPGTVASVGISDKGRKLEAGQFTEDQLRQYFRTRDLKGDPVPEDFYSKQFGRP
ncbi:twin-arginine translocation signal domain-containing protein [Bradyrhizobium sp. NBAIM08]|uniref:twin-arginine translocation signal domain-containing protein n=1 Tax=Bradyrhizobium sp. NBAIM08 TaxID=2793815 RepID=UPI001CD5C802|nr:twin-arginine translocation signal domain-containing protein [Bradyrhizobium sp. NBAIM08]MCA1479839.1 twin-arginine translocation signal domain-containing protein [Bradyrhizobium sp. NBAIM08]